ncbi:MAG: hypothetical protein U5L72_17400 [Bacteroidales bacterium]|nr:hypothetical protein [Bacteroidales bacterium]
MRRVTALSGPLSHTWESCSSEQGGSCIVNTTYLARIDLKQMQCVFIREDKEFSCEISRRQGEAAHGSHEKTHHGNLNIKVISQCTPQYSPSVH